MNQEDKKQRLITILLYVVFVLVVIGYSLIRGMPRGLKFDTLFAYAGLAGYILAGWCLLTKTRNKEAGMVGLAISVSYDITLLVGILFSSGSMPIGISLSYPLVMGINILCFFAIAVVIALFVRLGEYFMQKKVPQWMPNVRSWEIFFVLWISIPLIVAKKLDLWKAWYALRQTAQGVDLLTLFPPMTMVVCVFMAIVSFLFLWNAVRGMNGDSS